VEGRGRLADWAIRGGECTAADEELGGDIRLFPGSKLVLVLVLTLMLLNVAPEIIVVDLFWRIGPNVSTGPGMGVGTDDMMDDSLSSVFVLFLRSVLTHQPLWPAVGSGNW
jgi:hypothetical protein